MAFGQAVSTSLFEDIIRASEDRADAATNLTPPRLVRQRAIGTDPPPGLPHPTPSPPSQGLAALPSIGNPFQVAVSSVPTQRAVPFGGDVDEGAHPGWGGEAHPSTRPRRQAAGEPYEPILPQRQEAGQPPEPLISFVECIRLITRITYNDTLVPYTVRTIALHGIARVLDQHVLCASSSARADTIRDCAEIIRDIARDETMHPLLRRVVLNEILERLGAC